MPGIEMHRGFQDQVGSAIAAHSVWKKRLLTAIETGASDWTPAQVETHDNCTFGEWLASVPDAYHDDTYQAVHEAHAAFHQCAAKVLEQALSGDPTSASAAIKPGSAYANASFRLISAIAKWHSLLDE